MASGEHRTAREAVRAAAKSILETMPDGIRFTELSERVHEVLPKLNRNTIRGSLGDMALRLPPEIVKPARGLYIHRKFAPNAPIEGRPQEDLTAERGSSGRVREQDFYEPFADWLVNETEECTRAIALGGNRFKDKWGTPDVIGVREPRKSDIVKFTTEIVSAEVKTDGYQLITAFGQACAYRLFSHKSYLVIPVSAPEEDVARLDVLARTFEIGLILFEATPQKAPKFSIRVRPSKHEPDGFYVNKCLKLVESQLFG